MVNISFVSAKSAACLCTFADAAYTPYGDGNFFDAFASRILLETTQPIPLTGTETRKRLGNQPLKQRT